MNFIKLFETFINPESMNTAPNHVPINPNPAMENGKNYGDEKFTFEFFDRDRKMIRMGTLYQLNDREIKAGQLFIVPPTIDGRSRMGCLEGRPESIGYMLPIALYAKGNHGSQNHVSTQKGYGSWIRDRCFIEIE
jgi:hypothetical protein